MQNLTSFRIMIVVLLFFGIVSCKGASAINGSGYQMTNFSTEKAVLAVAQDPIAGPAIYSNNEQCSKDAACKK